MFKPDTKILVIDDMMTMRKLVSKHLKDLGYQNLAEADDGATAWPMIQHAASVGTPFGLILSDWNMPKMKGLDLLKVTREDKRFKTVPFIMITAESDKAQVIEAIKLGVSNYIVKPFTPQHLKEKLEVTWKNCAMPSATKIA